MTNSGPRLFSPLQPEGCTCSFLKSLLVSAFQVKRHLVTVDELQVTLNVLSELGILLAFATWNIYTHRHTYIHTYVHTHVSRIHEGSPQTRSYLLKGGPLLVCFPPLGECSRNPSESVRQLALLWEAVSASANFCWSLFQHICLFHDGWFMSAPAHTVLNIQQFLTKKGLIPVPHPPYSPDLAPAWNNFFCCFPDEKSPQREKFCWCGRGETKKWQKH